jgi:hypothetical protein
MKPIPGFPGYTITEEGVITNPKGKVLTRIDTWEGYHRARLKNEEGKFVNRKIHRLVALAHLGVKDGEIRHKDNNRANFHLHNLEWTDRTGNAADRLARGSYHLKTQLVGGKSLLILGDNKYLDPEAKKVYHVTDHPLGEDGVIPVTSLEKIAKLSEDDLGRIQNILNNYFKHKQQEKKSSYVNRLKENFVNKKLFDRALTDDTAKNLMIEHIGAIVRKSKRGKTFIKQAEWTSKNNADKHALKHAKGMGLSDEEYINAAVASLKEKKALINTRGDVSKSRVGKNILVHKDGKVITYYSKVAYVRRVKRHLESAVDNFKDWGYHQDVVQTHLDIKEKRKKK